MEGLTKEERSEALALFQALISFRTTSHSAAIDGEYTRCADYLVEQLLKAGLSDVHVIPESLPGKPIVVASLVGEDSSLPGLLLNCHIDVVPVVEADWTVPAFEGKVDEAKGLVYGRGTQDMKCVCAQYIVALKKIARSGRRLKRSLHVSFVPDEEIGGADGMNVLMQSDWFNSTGGKVDLVLDEGLASESDDFSVFYGERLPWWVFFDSQGNTGHGSRFIEGTAVESAAKIVNRALEYRENQRRLLHGHLASTAGCSHAVAAGKTLGDVTSVNVTQLQAGMVSSDGKPVVNVVPATARVGLDVRISPLQSPAEVESMLDAWCQEASKDGGAKTAWSFVHANTMKDHAVTDFSCAEAAPWWHAFSSSLQSRFGISCKPAVFPAATDSRFLRAHGYKALGFSPIRRSKIMLHENDEHLLLDVFFEGCDVYLGLLPDLANFVLPDIKA